MPRDRIVPRVRWRVARAACGGWWPVVMIGDAPVRLHVEHDKADARTVARQYAKKLRDAGQ